LLKGWVELMREKMHEVATSGEKADLLKLYNCTTFVSYHL
jgi:hypothetical protein